MQTNIHQHASVRQPTNLQQQPAAATRCYQIYQPRPQARYRVLLLPHAGGSASFFRPWCAAFGPEVEAVAIQYPGRENRLQEPLVDNMAELVSQLAQGLRPLCDKPYLLFGHSMGGAVAYQLYLALAAQQLPLPRQLVISASEGPGCQPVGNWHQQPDELLLAELSRLNGTNICFSSFPELAELVLPLLRNDYRLIETYQPDLTQAPIDCDLTVMLGNSDQELSLQDALAWQTVTRRAFAVRHFAGDHFYLRQQFPAMISELSALLGVRAASPEHICAP